MAPYDPPNAHYAHVSVAHMPEKNILRAIGPNGYNFKLLTDIWHIQYLWWNQKNNVIEIWGNHDSVASTTPKVYQYLSNFD